MVLSHLVAPCEEGMTLQALLRGPLALSAAQAREIKRAQGVTVDGAPFFSNQCVRAGQRVLVTLREYADGGDPPPRLPPVRVLYEDEALLAVYKPAMLQCHPSPSAPVGSDTLEARVHALLGRAAHPVHRLDAETSGIVLFAKLPYAQAHLQRQMAQGAFRKEYRAWVWGVPSPQGGMVDAPIARAERDGFTRVVREDGQRAVSEYALLQTARAGDAPVSLLALSPLTGRTHQLRVHMAHIGCPILGDARYASERPAALSRALGLTHQQLAAVSLRFVHPVTGAPLSLSCPAEFDFSPADRDWQNRPIAPNFPE